MFLHAYLLYGYPTPLITMIKGLSKYCEMDTFFFTEENLLDRKKSYVNMSLDLIFWYHFRF